MTNDLIQTWLKEVTKAAVEEAEKVQKASNRNVLASLLSMAYLHEKGEGDTAQMDALRTWASAHNVSDLLPAEAQAQVNVSGNAYGYTLSNFRKAIAKPIVVCKSWFSGNTAYFEGWMSTEERDQEGDEIPPEAFKGALPAYMRGGALLTRDHGNERIGYIQKAALVRDGKAFYEVEHPSDPADWEVTPTWDINGVYVRGAVTEEPHATEVKLQAIKGMSWIGNITKGYKLPGGGIHAEEVGAMWESTIANRPVNRQALITRAKAYGFEAQEENDE